MLKNLECQAKCGADSIDRAIEPSEQSSPVISFNSKLADIHRMAWPREHPWGSETTWESLNT